MKYIVAHFGLEVDAKAAANNTFIARVPVERSPTFYGWVFQFAGKIKILSPAKAIEEYENMTKR